MKKPLVVGNWKMNPASVRDAKKLFAGLTTFLAGKKYGVVVAPPYPFLHLYTKNKKLALGAQDMSMYQSGPHTGEVSAAMLKDMGVSYVILGHSERRVGGETDASVNAKVREVLKRAMTPIVCVGERERDQHGKYFGYVEAQIVGALKDVPRTKLGEIVLAYEPVWAISKGDGKGETATPEHAHEMKLFIQKVLVSLYGRAVGLSVPVLYGGSVNASNARPMMEEGMVDGFLVGGASLKLSEFAEIVKAAHR